MSNSYFRFKQFTVHQDACAMKVCTDACLFGAFLAEKVSNQKEEVKTILDIGTGTGLLSLMLAQTTEASIDAVEIDAPAALQAGSNFTASPWAARLQVHTQPVQQYASSGKVYDLVISNPPFFENDLKSHNNKRNLALHSEALTLEELFAAANGLTTPDGHFAVLLPFHRSEEVKALAARAGWHIKAEAQVQQTPKHTPFRIMLLFSRNHEPATDTEVIVIKDAEGQYTPAFSALLASYYLYL